MANTEWRYPGSRWWKFDFHTHTPASHDTPWHVQGLELSPEDWLSEYMAAEIDCVAVTDHNSGAWIDTLKAAYVRMKMQADAGQPPTGFRELTLFPGVEISANGGVHVLAIFDPTATASSIDSLLGAVGYTGTRGASDAETSKAVAEVIVEVLKAGAVPIPAHADAGKGLLRVNPGTRQCVLSANTVRQALEVEGLLAVEWCDPESPLPQAVEKLARSLTRVLGSDSHDFQGCKTPGSRYTWVKMAAPALEGLRLALLDGNGVSIRRSDEGPFDPFQSPPHVIRAIQIEQARVMGNGSPARVELSPYFNAIVGGRGTGKSTLVHALRLVIRREVEIQALPKDSEPRERFEAFRAVARGRDDRGALKPESRIRVEWLYEGTRLRLNWIAHGNPEDGCVEEWRNGQWQQSPSQSINTSRFPVRIFSQGQIAAMASGGRQGLLAIIDEAADVEALKQSLEEARRAFFAQRARQREIDAKIAALPEVERRLSDTDGKLKTLAQGGHAGIQQGYARAQHQSRAVDETLSQLRADSASFREIADRLVLDDWLPQYFGEDDADLLAWRKDADAFLEVARQRLYQESSALEQSITKLSADERLVVWRARVDAARQRHQVLQAQLAAQGVSDPQAFSKLTQDRQQLETQAKTLRQMQADSTALLRQIETQKALMLERRQSITKKRRAFLEDRLAQNDYVRIQAVPFGSDPMVVEGSLRELIEAIDERFSDAILNTEDGEAKSGLVFDFVQAADKAVALDRMRNVLVERPESLDGRFRNYLSKKAQKPEFVDHVLAWFPEDDLTIEYKRGDKWHAINEGSQGQRSAALLAFLLAFGEEPIVLDQPEDDLDNHLIYDLIVSQIRESKLRRQLIVVTHNPNVVVNGDADLVQVMDFKSGQCVLKATGALQEKDVREEVCRVMEGGREAFARRWKRLGKEV